MKETAKNPEGLLCRFMIVLLVRRKSKNVNRQILQKTGILCRMLSFCGPPAHGEGAAQPLRSTNQRPITAEAGSVLRSKNRRLRCPCTLIV